MRRLLAAFGAAFFMAGPCLAQNFGILDPHTALGNFGTAPGPAKSFPQPGGLDVRHFGASYPAQFYVATSGDDGGGNSFCLSSSSPCRTIAQAMAQANRFHANNQQITINIGAGTYSENVIQTGPIQGISNVRPFVTDATSVAQ